MKQFSYRLNVQRLQPQIWLNSGFPDLAVLIAHIVIRDAILNPESSGNSCDLLRSKRPERQLFIRNPILWLEEQIGLFRTCWLKLSIKNKKNGQLSCRTLWWLIVRRYTSLHAFLRIFLYEVENSFPIDVMFPNPERPSTSVYEFVQHRRRALQRVFELVRANLNKNQNWQDALYSQRVHDALYENGLSSPWCGPYVIIRCLNDVTYQIREISTNKSR